MRDALSSAYLSVMENVQEIHPTFWRLSLRFCCLFCINLEMWSVYFTAYLCLVFSFFFFFLFCLTMEKNKMQPPPQPTIALPVQRILDLLISSLACVYCCELVTNRQAPLQRLFLSCYVLLSIKILIWLASQKRQDPGCCAGTDLPAPWWSNLALTM